MSRSGGAASAAPIGTPVRVVDVRAMPKVLRRIVRMALKAAPARVALAIGASLGASVAALTLPKLFGHAVDQVQSLLAKAALARAAHAPAAQIALATRSAEHALMISALLIVVASAARGVLTGFGGYQAEFVSQKVAYQLRLDFFQQLQKLSFGFHDQTHSGDLISRGMLDLEGTRGFIQQGMMQFLTLVLLLSTATYLMIATDPRLAVIALAFTPFSAFVLARMGVRLRIAWSRIQRLMGVLTLTMVENLQGIRVVRAFAAKDFELAKFDKAASEALAESLKRIVMRYRSVSAIQIFYSAAMAALLWSGGRAVAGRTITPGRLTEFVFYMTLLQPAIRQIAMIVISAARATSCGGRLFEILDLEPAIVDGPHARPLAPTQGVLRFEHVDFAYVSGKPVLHDISFEIAPGRTLGIVGPPGGGKSTIANLIPRFYEPGGGRITIDGVDIRDVTLASLREYVGLVQQEAFLFDATVTNNVAYADPWAEEARIVEAARTAQIHGFVAGLPAAYDTRVGERGVQLSGGQRQRMSIARGVVPGPGIMVFDDSTASIDAVTEQRVREALAGATRAKATIIIAHRLSSLMHADEILVLEEGRIVERGTHAELLAMGGEYADLFHLQSRSAEGLSIAGERLRRPVAEPVE